MGVTFLGLLTGYASMGMISELPGITDSYASMGVACELPGITDWLCKYGRGL